MNGPYLTEPGIGVNGLLEDISPNVIYDAATMADYELRVCGAEVAMRRIGELDKIIASKTWRAEAAIDIKLRIIKAIPTQEEVKDAVQERELQR